MTVSILCNAPIALPLIGAKNRTRFNHGSDRSTQRGERGIRNGGDSDATDTHRLLFDRDQDERSPQGTPALPSFPQATKVHFIHFNYSRESFSPGAHHTSANRAYEVQRCFVSRDAQDVGQPERAHALFLRDHAPSSLEPRSQGQTTSVKKRASGHRHVAAASFATKYPAMVLPRVGMRTRWARERIAPPNLEEILTTCFFCPELTGKLLRRLRIFFGHSTILSELGVLTGYAGTRYLIGSAAPAEGRTPKENAHSIFQTHPTPAESELHGKRFLSGLPRSARRAAFRGWCRIGADDQGYITAHAARARSILFAKMGSSNMVQSQKLPR